MGASSVKPKRETATESVARRIDLAVTHYDVMGVPPGATEEAIRAARRDLQRLFHPDFSRHERSHELMSRVNIAQSILLDAEERRKYDFKNQIKAQTCKTCKGNGFVLRQKGFKAKVSERCPTCLGVGAQK